jgi:hypothetical protein
LHPGVVTGKISAAVCGCGQTLRQSGEILAQLSAQPVDRSGAIGHAIGAPSGEDAQLRSKLGKPLRFADLLPPHPPGT